MPSPLCEEKYQYGLVMGKGQKMLMVCYFQINHIFIMVYKYFPNYFTLMDISLQAFL